MKKPEKEKGKQREAARKKKYMQLALAAGVLIMVAVIIGFVAFSTSGAKTGYTVSIYYTGTLDDGTVFDTNEGGKPLTFVLGTDPIIPGLQEAVSTMTLNETKTVRIPADKAYGPYRDELVHTVNRSQLFGDAILEPGQFYTIRRTSDSAVSIVKILNVTPSSVTIDENHELAEKDLTFQIRLVGIRR
jgi:peptidylprolyl isomerase